MTTLELPEIAMPGGVCHFVATPIGNMQDITLRALGVLAAAEVVYAEDTRHTAGLLKRYGLRAPLTSYHDHNKQQVVPRIVADLQAQKKVAVVSDAGMPCVNDPGYSLVKALREADLPWTIIPGPSSVLAAVVLAGFSPDRFLFAGYPPRKKGQRSRFLEQMLQAGCTVVLLESCHRITGTLEMLAALDAEREVAVVREITKIHEETLRGPAAEVLPLMTGKRLRGELVLVLDAPPKADRRQKKESRGE